QAREATIEAGLERVRYKAMAMQSSEDVGSATAVVFNEISLLGVETMRCGITIIHPDKTGDVWAATTTNEGKEMKGVGSINFQNHPLWVGLFTAWQNKEENFSYHLKGEDLNAYYKALANSPNYSAPYLEDEMPEHFFYASFFEEGAVFTFSLLEHNEENKKILRKFTAVFSLTFRRYRDLKKAEAQAREAQIETALERVRSRSMAMHQTSELQAVIHTVHKELLNLNLSIDGGSFVVINDDVGPELRCWGSGGTANTSEEVQVPHFNMPFCTNLVKGIKSGPGFFTEEFSQEEKKKYFTKLFKHKPWSDISTEQKKETLSSSGGYTRSVAVSKHTAIFIINHLGKKFTDDENDILKRFAKVFEQTYTRFLDLQKAEAQTRQAQIETAMEKVRARALAMQKPEELIEVAQVLRKEMSALGVEELETSSIYIHNEVEGTTECWYAIKDIRADDKKLVSDHMTINLNDTWVGRKMLRFYNSDKKQISIPMQGDVRKEWINYCADHSKVLVGFYGDNIPDRTYHLYKFSNGYMGAASPGDISLESWDLLQRATSVFSLAYTRFSDLQIAEASAREAIKQSALDRIRADIASMRTISDLDRITPLIWNELTILGIPFIRCGVFIMDDVQQLIHTFLSTPDGQAIAAFHLPYDTPGNVSHILNHWQHTEKYLDHWNEKEFTTFADILVKQGELASSEQYLKTIPKGGFYLHFLPFLQG
ncbi:MAG: hypothetical protein M3004_02120, partial [Bacteroidota bacterium]|nr:hypothetical protein [Bacteroidota bacterium]